MRANTALAEMKTAAVAAVAYLGMQRVLLVAGQAMYNLEVSLWSRLTWHIGQGSELSLFALCSREKIMCVMDACE